MALTDFFWACPTCRTGRLEGDQARCASCGTRYRRGRGSDIVAVAPDDSQVARSPADWIDRLPTAMDLLRAPRDPSDPVRAAQVEIRRVTGDRRIHSEHGYLNRVEVFGEPATGLLEAFADHLRVTPQGQGTERWPLESLTAVQASSGALQLKRRDQPLVAFRFADDAVYFWELLLHATLRDFYRQTGRGEIIEFQPRIVTR